VLLAVSLGWAMASLTVEMLALEILVTMLGLVLGLSMAMHLGRD
jgi:hypothetical protein